MAATIQPPTHVEAHASSSRNLRRALLANASFSICSGALFILAGGPLSRLIGLPLVLPIQLIGAGLIPFACYLIWIARKPDLRSGEGRLTSLMDAAWVLGTFILLVGWPDLLNVTGRVLALLVAAAVGGFAIWQIVGARQMEEQT